MGIFVVIIKISTLQHYVVTIVSLVFGAKASRYTAVYLKKILIILKLIVMWRVILFLVWCVI